MGKTVNVLRLVADHISAIQTGLFSHVLIAVNPKNQDRGQNISGEYDRIELVDHRTNGEFYETSRDGSFTVLNCTLTNYDDLNTVAAVLHIHIGEMR
jgi:hypothetical protein